MKLPVCAHCKSLVIDPSLEECDYCHETLACEEIEERDFTPLLLVAGIRDNLMLNHNTACRLFFRNFDGGPIKDLRIRLKSRTADVACVERPLTIARGMDTQKHPGTAQFKPDTAGDLVLSFMMDYTDCRGAVRSYEGDLVMNINEPAANMQEAHITFNVTNSKMMGVDISDMVRIHGGERGDSNPSTVDGFRRLPIAMWQIGFTAAPPPSQPVQSGRVFPPLDGRYRLLCEGPDAGRRVMILTQNPLALGMKKYTSDPSVGLTLRLLPCRSEALDAENWQKTRYISSPHATLKACGDRFEIHDEQSSKNGVYLAEGGGERPAAARQLPKGKWERLPERCEIFIGRDVLQLSAQVFRGAAGVDALRLTRVNNLPELEYVMAVRGLRIGAGAECAVRVNAPDYPVVVATLAWNGAVWSLTAAVESPQVRLNGRALRAGEAAPITAASRIQAGAYQWNFDAAAIEDFTEV